MTLFKTQQHKLEITCNIHKGWGTFDLGTMLFWDLDEDDYSLVVFSIHLLILTIWYEWRRE